MPGGPTSSATPTPPAGIEFHAASSRARAASRPTKAERQRSRRSARGSMAGADGVDSAAAGSARSAAARLRVGGDAATPSSRRSRAASRS